MKPTNLNHIVIANTSLTDGQRDGLYRVWGINPKPKELMSLDKFVQQLVSLSPFNLEMATKILGDCYYGFAIPRISKEFDCLWIGENTVVNIELKSQDVGVERIKKQLCQNRYYLQHLKKTIVSFAYDSSMGACYAMDESERLQMVSFTDLTQALLGVHGEKMFVDDIETLFPPESFLVSPFNSTEEFLGGCYFLTDQQQDFKNHIMKFVDNGGKDCFCALTGGPGSGKTLLLYDIAKTLMELGKEVVVGHAGGLNNGHKTLNRNGWRIKPTKDLLVKNYATGDVSLIDADVYLLDEAQRCFNFTSIVNEVAKNGKKCVLSYDAGQIMSNDEKRRDNASKIQTLVDNRNYLLSSNIRTNADVYEFVSALFDKRHSVNRDIHDHVEITYCQTIDEAIVMLRILDEKGFVVPQFTPKMFGSEDYESWFPFGVPSAHEVIGQEFDNVAGLLSDKVYYDDNGKLVSRGKYYYREDRMLYQILTRARHKIHLVIFNNPVLLERCTKLMGK